MMTRATSGKRAKGTTPLYADLDMDVVRRFNRVIKRLDRAARKERITKRKGLEAALTEWMDRTEGAGVK